MAIGIYKRNLVQLYKLLGALIVVYTLLWCTHVELHFKRGTHIVRFPLDINAATSTNSVDSFRERISTFLHGSDDGNHTSEDYKYQKALLKLFLHNKTRNQRVNKVKSIATSQENHTRPLIEKVRTSNASSTTLPSTNRTAAKQVVISSNVTTKIIVKSSNVSSNHTQNRRVVVPAGKKPNYCPLLPPELSKTHACNLYERYINRQTYILLRFVQSTSSTYIHTIIYKLSIYKDV